jgi:hypothetical protein
MAKKPTTTRSKRTSKSHPVENTTEETRRDPKRDKDAEAGAPIEHYHVEPKRDDRTGSPGSVEEETLDHSAPYNRTYGK